MKKLLIFDSHPVQYRVPIWKSLFNQMPGCLHVVYATDCSVKGHIDEGFGQQIAWDEPLLEGYEFTVLNCTKGQPLVGSRSLTGNGINKIIEKIKPDAILLTGLNYKYDWIAYLAARRNKLPLLLRCETQDEAFTRPLLKTILRKIIYWFVYKGISHFFYIGNKNKEHYLNHGVPEQKLSPALYGTINRLTNLSDDDKQKMRIKLRNDAKIEKSAIVIGFSGKFIDKKNPVILFEALKYLPPELRKRIVLYFMGSGELEAILKEKASISFAESGVNAIFPGFINQSQIGNHYLIMDIFILPSRRMGETWGLVVNEALQAGCATIVSNAVGCSADFKNFDNFLIFNEGDAADLAKCIADLSKIKRDFNWAFNFLKPYSIDISATNILNFLLK